MALNDKAEVTFSIQMLPHELKTFVEGETASYTPGATEHWWWQYTNCPTATNSQLIPIDAPLLSHTVSDGDGELPAVAEVLDVCKFLYISNAGTDDLWFNFANYGTGSLEAEDESHKVLAGQSWFTLPNNILAHEIRMWTDATSGGCNLIAAAIIKKV